MRVVTPDTSLWKYLSSLFDTLGGLQALVLIACVIGVITGCVLWAVASEPIARRGRWGGVRLLRRGRCGREPSRADRRPSSGAFPDGLLHASLATPLITFPGGQAWHTVAQIWVKGAPGPFITRKEGS